MTLHPTPTRVALLQAVADGRVEKVVALYGGYDWVLSPVPQLGSYNSEYRVNARVVEVIQEGWVQVVDDKPVLTSAGRAVLDEAAQP